MSTKETVLSILERNRGQTLSGQQIADMLGISRSAVWKAIRLLQGEGHQIAARRNRGYSLGAESDLLSEEGIRAHLPAGAAVSDIYVYPVVDSTNTQAKRMALEGARHGTLVVAEEQIAGRGRFGKRFYSPGRTGLYMSVILRPSGARAADAQGTTIAVAVAVCEAIEALTDRRPQIKWVNDLYLNGRKICGILSEAVGDFESGGIDSIVVGVGVNCRTEDFPEELSGIAGSLGAPALSRNRLAARVAAGILEVWPRRASLEIIERYRARSLMIGKSITYSQGHQETAATVLAINDQGNLVVRDESCEVRTLSSGEVSIRGDFS